MNENPKKIKMVDIIRPEKKIEPQKRFEIKKEVLKEETKEFFRPQIIEIPKRSRPIIQIKEVSLRRTRDKRVPIKINFKLVLAVIIVGFLVYLAFWVLPKAEINVVTKKTSIELNAQIVADKNTSEINLSSNRIPAEAFSQKKNSVLSFPATGKKNVERKARGEVIIFNTFSSDSQPLIANTRILTPDGKVFHIERSIVVPGAKIIDGKIVSSSIAVTVIADKAGQEYNIGPVARFTIPGFQGSEKYQSFYAKSDFPMTGGFIGEVKVPTDDDINKAKQSAGKSLREYFDSFFSVQIPHDFKIIDGADQFSIVKEEAGKEADDQGNFSITIEASKSIIGFKESDVVAIFSNLAKGKLADGFTLDTYEISYMNTIADFNKKTLTFSANFKGMFKPPLDANVFKQKILDKNELDLKTFIFSQPDIDKATVSFWPFWVKRVPSHIDKINVIVQ